MVSRSRVCSGSHTRYEQKERYLLWFTCTEDPVGRYGKNIVNSYSTWSTMVTHCLRLTIAAARAMERPIKPRTIAGMAGNRCGTVLPQRIISRHWDTSTCQRSGLLAEVTEAIWYLRHLPFSRWSLLLVLTCLARLTGLAPSNHLLRTGNRI